MAEKVLILGAGLYVEEVAEIIDLNNHEIIAFIEGIDQTRCGEYILNKPVVWIEDIDQYPITLPCIAAIGSVKRKNIIDQVLKFGFRFITIVHPGSQIASSTKLGNGISIGAGTVIGANSLINDHVIINRGCLIGHHVTIGSFSTVAPGANIAGKVRIEDGCYIGMGAIIIDGIKVGSGSIIGAGAVVTRDVPENVQVIGIPAQITKRWI